MECDIVAISIISRICFLSDITTIANNYDKAYMYYITTTEALPYLFLIGRKTKKIGNNWKIMNMNACHTANNFMRVLI